MIALNEKQRIVIKRLSQTDDFKAFVSMLEQSLVEKDVKNRIINDPTILFRGQGAAQELVAIIKATNPV